MKKSLLLVAFATCATSAAFAQRAASVNNFSVQNMAVVEAEECPAQDLYISNGRAAKVQKAEEENKVKAWYHRPAVHSISPATLPKVKQATAPGMLPT